MYIDGQFCESSNGKWIDVLNPSTEEVISRQPEGTVEDVNRALDAARAAQKSWAKTPAIERAGYLLKIAEGIKKREKEDPQLGIDRSRRNHSLLRVHGHLCTPH